MAGVADAAYPIRVRVMVLGATGMLGHVVFRHIARGGEVEAIGVMRALPIAKRPPGIGGRLVVAGDLTDAATLLDLIAEARPDVIVNCVGLVKQRAGASDLAKALAINTILSRRLATMAAAAGFRLIQISTDCVFSGAAGFYREADVPDADDAYGISKWLGEVDGAHCLTLRTSIVGPELAAATGLFEWFRAQHEPVDGYRRSIFSGLTTVELARVIKAIIAHFPDLGGLYHVASAPISKLALLGLFRDHLGKDIVIREAEGPAIDRSLDGSRFAAATGWRAPDWRSMVAEIDHV